MEGYRLFQEDFLTWTGREAESRNMTAGNKEGRETDWESGRDFLTRPGKDNGSRYEAAILKMEIGSKEEMIKVNNEWK